MPTPLIIISGGQTGVDRAALDAAIKRNIPHMGWCPKDRWAEDGRISRKYNLRETSTSSPTERTKLNVHECHGSLVLSVLGFLDAGTTQTIEFLESMSKPFLLVDLNDPPKELLGQAVDWLNRYGIRLLNIAGPRESELPGIYDRSFQFLLSLFQDRWFYPLI